MPASWVSAGIGAVGLINSMTGGGGSSGGGGGGNGYVPWGLNEADSGWRNAFAHNQDLVSGAAGVAIPGYQNSYNQAAAINYAPYQQAANVAGQQYGNLANVAGQQMGQYGQNAALAGQQQQHLYDAGNQIWSTAQDPQNALYNRTQQQLSDQVNAGQAQRGLGVSPVGGQEYNQAMSNFNIDWQNQQLARQLQGVQGLSQASNAGGQQGQLQGANLAAALNAGQNQAAFTQQAAQTPINAQQYIAGQPAANANNYAANFGNLEQQYGNLQSSAIPYMNQGVGATQWNANFANQQQQQQAQQNAANARLLTQGLGSGGSNGPGAWLSNIFGSGGSSGSAGGNAYTGYGSNPYSVDPSGYSGVTLY